MSRIQMIQKNQGSPEVEELYAKLEENGTKILNLYKVLAYNSHVLRNFLRLGNSLLTRSKLSPKLRELAILRIAQITNSEYEWNQHYTIALEVGVSHAQTEAISHWNDSINFNSEEKAVLKYTDEVEQNIEVKDETFQVLSQHLSEQSIVELTLSIGYWGMVARLLVPLQVDMDTQAISSAQELMGYRS